MTNEEKNEESGEVEIYTGGPEHTDTNVSALTGDSTGNLMQAIERVAMNPNADIEKMKVLKDMLYEFQDREAERLYGEDMALCQGEIEPVARNAINKHTNNSTYAKLDAICKDINPIYSRHGFSVGSKTAPSEKENHFLIITTIRHKAGHKEIITLDWPIDNAGMEGKINKTQIHGSSSTITYARRVSICMGFNVATTDDDDGNQGRTAEPEQSKVITEEQVKELEKLLVDSGTTAESLCEQAGISNLTDLRTQHFGPAKQHIEDCRGEAK